MGGSRQQNPIQPTTCTPADGGAFISPSIGRVSLPFAAGVSSAEPAIWHTRPRSNRVPPHGVAFARQTRAQGGSIDRPVASYGLRAAVPIADRFFVPVPTWCRRHFRRSRALGHNFLKRLAGGLGFEPRLAESESAVLPLDDPPPAGGAAQAWASVAGELTSTPGRDWVGPGSAGGAGGRAKRGYFAARASSVSR